MNYKKRVISSLLAVVMIFSACLIMPVDADAAEKAVLTTPDGIKYVEYDVADAEKHLGKSAPAYSGVDEDYGYLFGGWYIEKDDVYHAVSTVNDLNTMETGDILYAKFVPAYVLSVKCQNYAGTTEGQTNGTKIRVISSIDSKNYKCCGFEVYTIYRYFATKTYKVKTLGTYETKDSYLRYSVYESADAKEPRNTYSPSQIFGEASEYLTACLVGTIPPSAFTRTIGIRPYWKTLDGVQVYGLARYAHVEDDYEGYINVPVNLQNAKPVAAGMLTVKYDSSTYEFIDAVAVNDAVECGRVFEEITAIDDNNGRIECVGNIGAYSEGNQESSNIYVNLRFRLATGEMPPNGITVADFDVVEESFCNLAETIFEGDDYNVWKVKAGVLR